VQDGPQVEAAQHPIGDFRVGAGLVPGVQYFLPRRVQRDGTNGDGRVVLLPGPGALPARGLVHVHDQVFAEAFDPALDRFLALMRQIVQERGLLEGRQRGVFGPLGQDKLGLMFERDDAFGIGMNPCCTCRTK
jgi:hypothetical protein